MEDHEQRHLIDVLADYRERLESARMELDGTLDEDGIPSDPIARQMLAVEARMLDIQKFLAEDLERQSAPAAPASSQVPPAGPPAGEPRTNGRVRLPRPNTPRAQERWRELTTPRLGRLRHYAPAPLQVPTSYFRAEPPRPAPTISIVTPSYEQGRFLERTLYSVISQNYPALEYVVQDGGSKDESVEILSRYGPSLKSWASERDRGQADAINRGFAHTSGEIMAYLNSDDMLLPGALAYVASYFAAHPEVDVVYGNRLIVDEHDRQVGVWVLPPHDDEELAVIDFVPQETLFWRRAAWEAAGGEIDANLRFALDWDLLLRMRDSGARIVRLPRFLGAFRTHEDQKTIAWNDQCMIECDALRRRVHGRGMSHEETVARAAPYMRRHVLYHFYERLKTRATLSRSYVRTLPLEPWLRAGASSPNGKAPQAPRVAEPAARTAADGDEL